MSCIPVSFSLGRLFFCSKGACALYLILGGGGGVGLLFEGVQNNFDNSFTLDLATAWFLSLSCNLGVGLPRVAGVVLSASEVSKDLVIWSGFSLSSCFLFTINFDSVGWFLGGASFSFLACLCLGVIPSFPFPFSWPWLHLGGVGLLCGGGGFRVL